MRCQDCCVISIRRGSRLFCYWQVCCEDRVEDRSKYATLWYPCVDGVWLGIFLLVVHLELSVREVGPEEGLLWIWEDLLEFE